MTDRTPPSPNPALRRVLRRALKAGLRRKAETGPRRKTKTAAALAASLGVCVAFGLFPATAAAQIASDGSLGPAQTLNGPNFVVPAELGTQRGGNLFHSFSTFSIPSGGSATFTGPADATRIISRVTGGTVSSIDGRLASAVAGADVYLVNPAGVVFGPNASLDVSGGFHASAAAEVRFADGAVFDAARPSRGGLSVAEPSSFGFGTNPGPLTVNGATLTAPPGKTLSLSGGDVDVTNGAELRTRGGGVSVTAGRFSLRNGAELTAAADSPVADSPVAAPPAGALEIRGGAVVVVVSGDALIASGGAINTTDIGAGIGAGASGPISATAGKLTIDGAGAPPGAFTGLRTTAAGNGRGGAITLRAGDATIKNGGAVSANAMGNGPAGDVAVAATNALILQGGRITTTSIGGDGGDVSLSAGTLIYTSRSDVLTSVGGGAGAGGNIVIGRPRVAASNNSRIMANAVGGPGGSIVVAADGMMASADTVVDASSTLGVSGSVYVKSPDNELVGNLTPPAAEFADPTRLLRLTCADRGAAENGGDAGRLYGAAAPVGPSPDGPLLPALAGDRDKSKNKNKTQTPATIRTCGE